MRFFSSIILTLYFGTVISQTTNSYLFIEPNVSIKYDSTVMKVKERFPNTLERTESYFMDYIPTGAHVKIDSKISLEQPTQKYQDSLLDKGINQFTKIENDSVVMTDKPIPVHYKGFTGIGIVSKIKVEKEKGYVVVIYCTKYYEGGSCNVWYSTTRKRKPKGFDKDYNALTSILDGVTTFTEKDFALEDSLLRAKYKVVVDSIVPVAKQRVRGWKFLKVIVAPEPDNKIVGVSVENAVFYPDSSGNLFIGWSDKQKGKFEKQGELLVLNSFGKKVGIPFTFIYNNP